MVGVIFWVAILVIMNALMSLIVLFVAHGTKDKASKIGFGTIIFVYLANILTLIGGIIL